MNNYVYLIRDAAAKKGWILADGTIKAPTLWEAMAKVSSFYAADQVQPYPRSGRLQIEVYEDVQKTL